MLALCAGVCADALAGDPRCLPHPVVYIGKLIVWLEQRLRRAADSPARQAAAGAALVCVVCSLSFWGAWAVVWLAERLGPWAGWAVQAFVCFQLIAARGLYDAGRAICRPLAAGDLPGARAALSMIVGRDTDSLSLDAVVRAAVESVAENTSDGVVAPLFWFALAGAPGAMLYKAINTMDSMLGYKNEKYLYFGRVAARLDDAANFVPARLTALLLVLGAAFIGADAGGAVRTCWRDHALHTSPNAGWPEAAAAGALGLRLGGPSSYGGVVVDKPYIGQALRAPEPADIMRACRLLCAATLLALPLCCCIMRMTEGWGV